MIVGIGRKKQAGKDTTAHIINEDLSNEEVVIDSFAAGLKQTLLELFPQVEPRHMYGTDADKNEIIEGLFIPKLGGKDPATGRKLMQFFGTEVCRNIYADIWVNQLLDRAKRQTGKVVITCDVRFKNEADALKKAGAVMIEVQRDSADSSGDQHQSEIDLDDWEGWDHQLDNNQDLEHLSNQVHPISEKIAQIVKEEQQ